ncbi:glycosylhydrolase family 18-9 [Colletotrichum chrysophilum]|uniref:Glycosylhydrolase family 18-9 n=1 Tax=Colletotrichum chrysophilum TaxID=1836956 RepID=A0AAD9AFL9_9PEZI|nr:glycosylhydrolase family 18-9 [Colletotrichum chrysophilum]
MRGSDQRKAVSVPLRYRFYYLQHFDMKNFGNHPEKVISGLSICSRSSTLQIPGVRSPSGVVNSGGNAGECPGKTGVLLHHDIVGIVSKYKLTSKSSHPGPRTFPHEIHTAVNKINKDRTNIKALTSTVGDKQWTCQCLFPPRPQRNHQTQPTLKFSELCRWSGRRQNFPVGFKTVQHEGQNEIMLDNQDRPAGGSSPIFEQDLIYEDSCLRDSIILATEVSGVKAEYDCFGGARAYCCEPPKSAFPSVTMIPL